MAVKRKRPAGSGAVRQLPSGRWQARFRGPDEVMRPAERTFDTKLDAAAWLRRQERDVVIGEWQAPGGVRQVGTLGGYAEAWLLERELKPRTRAEYRKILDGWILPALADVRLDRLTPESVRTWYASLDASKPTRRAHAYGLLRAICMTAYREDLITANPCRVAGAGRARKQHKTETATLSELDAIVQAIPPRYGCMVLLAAWCGLRFGELAELRRRDLDLERGVVRVERAVTRVERAMVIGDPKSEAGKRVVTIPRHLLPLLADHLAVHVLGADDALLFPARQGGHLSASTLHKVWDKARTAAGRPDLHFHDLRHTGLTLAAATGATLADLMARAGHSTASAAMRYQHAAQDRDRAIADALADMAEAQAVPLRPRR